MSIDFAFICTNYNNSNYTFQFVESIIKISNFDESKHKIVVVDNSLSEIETQKLSLITIKYPFVILIYSKTNLGYFGGLNLGINHIRSCYKSINDMLIGNNDLKLTIDFFSNLNDLSDILTKYPVICPDIIRLDQVHQNPHVKEKVLFYKHFLLDLYYSNYYLGKFMFSINKVFSKIFPKSELDFQYEGEILQGYGACYILSSVFFDNFELLESPTFLMGEEAFLSLQIQKKGFYAYYTNKLKVFHIDHATVGQIESYHFWKISSKSHKIYRKLIPLNWRKK